MVRFLTTAQPQATAENRSPGCRRISPTGTPFGPAYVVQSMKITNVPPVLVATATIHSVVTPGTLGRFSWKSTPGRGKRKSPLSGGVKLHRLWRRSEADSTSRPGNCENAHAAVRLGMHTLRRAKEPRPISGKIARVGDDHGEDEEG